MVRRRESDNPREQAIQECRRIVAQTLITSEVADSLEDPQIPEVLVNPAFLVVPKLGSLVTIDIQSMPENRRIWDFTLPKIEDLFEIKMSTGEQTVVSLILFQWTESRDNEDAVSLLRRMFDHVVTIYPNGDLRQTVTSFVRELLGNPVSRENLKYLWQLESEARQSNFTRITNLSYVQKVLEAHSEFQRKPPRPKRRSLQKDLFTIEHITSSTESVVFDRLLAEPPFWIQDNPRVMNMKQYLLNSLTQYYFTFDFAFSPNMLDNGFVNFFDQDSLDRLFETGGGLGKFIKGSKGAFGRISFLRRLATYARFISYEPQGQNISRLRLRSIPPRLFLVIEEENIFGPSYAPDRYLNMLIHAGWRPVKIGDVTKEALLEGVNNA